MQEGIKVEERGQFKQGAGDYNPSNPVSHYILPHLLNLYASHAKAQDFEMYAPNATSEDPLMRAEGVKQIKSSFYSLGKILQCLSIQGLTSSGGSNSMGVNGQNSSGVSRALVKERLKTVNMQFEDLHQRQSQWTVPDTELRESLTLAVAEVLLPAYRSFIKRFGPMVESGKNPQKYIRYSAEDLERMLGEFFVGKNIDII